MGEIQILLGSAGLCFMRGFADELLLCSKSSACGFTSREANVTVQCCWKAQGFVPSPFSLLLAFLLLGSAELPALALTLALTGAFLVPVRFTKPAENYSFCWKNDHCEGVNVLPLEVSCWISSLRSWNCGLCHVAPRPQADCRDCAAPGWITPEPPGGKQAADGLLCSSEHC